jgi:hypothetical protein
MKKIITILLVCVLLAGLAFADNNSPEPALYNDGNDLTVMPVSIDSNAADDNRPNTLNRPDPRLRDQIKQRVKARVNKIIAKTINEVRKDYQKQVVAAVRDANDEVKEELKELRQAINTRIRQELREKKLIDYSDYNGMEQRITIARDKIKTQVQNALDSNILPITARIKRRIHNRLIEIRNDRNKIEIVDGNVVVETDEEVSIDDNGIHVKNKRLRVLPKAIKAKAIKKIKLNAIKDKIQYQVSVRNRRNLLGFIPMDVQEEIHVDAETGAIKGYERPWWAFLATGADVEADVELEE